MSHSGSPFEDKSGATPDGEAGPTSFAAGTKLKLINRAITKQTGRRLAFSSDNSNMADAATRGLDMLNRLSHFHLLKLNCQSAGSPAIPWLT